LENMKQANRGAIIYYFANGGYFMRALMRLWNLAAGKQERMISAKRVWTDKDIKCGGAELDKTEGSYGVLVSETE